MGEMRIKIEDRLLNKLESLAQFNNRSVEDQASALLRHALEDQQASEPFSSIAKRIAAMTPKGIQQPDSLAMLKEDRSR